MENVAYNPIGELILIGLTIFSVSLFMWKVWQLEDYIGKIYKKIKEIVNNLENRLELVEHETEGLQKRINNEMIDLQGEKIELDEKIRAICNFLGGTLDDRYGDILIESEPKYVLRKKNQFSTAEESGEYKEIFRLEKGWFWYRGKKIKDIKQAYERLTEWLTRSD